MMHDVSELPLLQSALSEALVITNQELGNIQLIDWKTGQLKIMAQQGFSEEFLDCSRRVTIRDGCACGRALFNRQPVIVDEFWIKYDNLYARAASTAKPSPFLKAQPIALYNI